MTDESPSQRGDPSEVPVTPIDLMGELAKAVTLLLSRVESRADRTLPDLRVGLVDLDRVLEVWINAAVVTNSAVEYFADNPDRFLMAAASQMSMSDRVFEWLGLEYDAPSTRRLDIDTDDLQRLFEIYAPEVRDRILKLLRSRRELVDCMLNSYGGPPNSSDAFMRGLNSTLDDLREAQYRLRAFIRESFPLH